MQLRFPQAGVVFLAAALLAGCSKPYVRDELASGELPAAARIGVLPVNYLPKPSVDVHDNLIGLAGTAGKIAVIKGRDTKRRKFTLALQEQGFEYRERADALLQSRLAEAGLNAEFMDFKRSIDNILEAVPPRRFEKRYPKQSGFDALLDIYVDYVGYAAVGLDDPYLPTVHVGVRLVDAVSLEPLYESMIQYHPLEAEGEESIIDPDSQFAFENFDQIIDEAPRARDGLHQAIVSVVDRLAEEISTASR